MNPKQQRAREVTRRLSDQRLRALRESTGLTDAEVLAQAKTGTLPPGPEYAEWVILLTPKKGKKRA